MIKRSDLPGLLHIILLDLGGRAEMMTIFKEFYNKYGKLFTEDNPLFYTWNYDIRWAATALRRDGIMAPAKTTINAQDNIISKGIWSLTGY